MANMSKHSPAPIAFEPEFIAGLREIFEQRIVFNQILGLKIVTLLPERVVARIDMKPDLVGHFAYNRLHGGVISAGLDATGALAVMAATGAKHMDEPPARRLERFHNWARLTCAWTTCAPALGRILNCMPKCCAWARAWLARAWSL